MAPARLSKSLLGSFRATSLRPATARQQCCYHSYEYTQPPPFPPAESAILSAAISHVPSYGFTSNALKLGARDAGYLDVSTNLLPRGVFDLINYHLVTQRLALKDSVQFPPQDQPGTGKKLGVGAKALAIMAQPSYVPTSVAELARLADEIWFLAGDASVDTSWYTKRASLSAIYSATEVFMTQDRSKNFAETEQFLDARLEDVMKVGGFLGAFGEWMNYTGHSAVNVLRSKGVRI
ncbi:ubiquinone biosynthesis protein COQ9, mitochondrial precursor [Clohesyomyces aquaticus]|uniref:Ubiquinone biosynthesis protein n=1 Tax=Clohesyomyces aquaticus TaxID=1231657 RepID=A0A1Y1Y4I1_9PLEO|nr:ubiquinone biosynthesis protein COQ9, mitochondrial precursor [Clohesyomyces aquaticus]